MIKNVLVGVVALCAVSQVWGADPVPAKDAHSPPQETASKPVPAQPKPVEPQPTESSSSSSPQNSQAVMHSSPVMQTAEERAVEKAVREGKDPREAVKAVQRQNDPK